MFHDTHSWSHIPNITLKIEPSQMQVSKGKLLNHLPPLFSWVPCRFAAVAPCTVGAFSAARCSLAKDIRHTWAIPLLPRDRNSDRINQLTVSFKFFQMQKSKNQQSTHVWGAMSAPAQSSKDFCNPRNLSNTSTPTSALGHRIVDD